MLARLLDQIRDLKRDRFLRAAGILISGTVVAQALGLLALPLLTRFYRPEDFSVLAAYVAILAMMASVTTMRFDAAIPLPEDDATAGNLLVLALISTASVVCVTALLIFFAGSFLARAAGRPEIESYLWLVPFGLGMTAVFSAFQYTATRIKAFPMIARTKMTQAFAGLGAQIGLGWIGLAPLGLLLGHALMSSAGVVALAVKTLKRQEYVKAVSRHTLWRTMLIYRHYPQYSVAGELANNAGIQLPILLIATMLAGPEGGLLFMAMRAIGTPLTIVGTAAAQVYYSEAAGYLRAHTLPQETIAVFKKLSRFLVLPMMAVGPLAPDLFRIVFGPDWERAGVMVVMMMPWYAFRLISSPISMVMYVCARQRTMLLMTLAGLILRIAPLFATIFYAPAYATLTFSITSALFYAGIVIVFLRVAGIETSSLIRLLSKELTLWIVAAAGGFTICKVIFYA